MSGPAPGVSRLPWLVAYTVAAGIAGVLAGMPPARSAARLDVLRAVASE